MDALITSRMRIITYSNAKFHFKVTAKVGDFF